MPRPGCWSASTIGRTPSSTRFGSKRAKSVRQPNSGLTKDWHRQRGDQHRHPDVTHGVGTAHILEVLKRSTCASGQLLRRTTTLLRAPAPRAQCLFFGRANRFSCHGHTSWHADSQVLQRTGEPISRSNGKIKVLWAKFLNLPLKIPCRSPACTGFLMGILNGQNIRKTALLRLCVS